MLLPGSCSRKDVEPLSRRKAMTPRLLSGAPRCHASKAQTALSQISTTLAGALRAVGGRTVKTKAAGIIGSI